MKQSPNLGHQQDPRRAAYIDEQLMADRTGRKAFKSSAYSLGIGIGFLILSPLLPDFGDPERSKAMFGVFRTVALWMVGYSLVVALGFFFARDKIKMILGILNWIIIPTIGIWAVMEISGILTGPA